MNLSDDLVLEARTVGAVARRSIAGQVEFWARLGKSIEPLLRGERALALQRSGMLVRIDEDGTRTRGRFINRAFVAAR